MAGAVASGRIRELFDAARPQHVWYQRGRERLEEYRKIAAAGGWSPIADGPDHVRPLVHPVAGREHELAGSASGRPGKCPSLHVSRDLNAG